MQIRAFCSILLFVLCCALVECTQSPTLTSIQLTPSGSISASAGQSIQFKAVGSYNRAGTHPTQLIDITNEATWLSSNSTVATITPQGSVTTVSNGTTTISASVSGIVGSATMTVTSTAVRALTSVTVFPATETIASTTQPSQFIAIGTYNTSPITVDLTSQVMWQSSNVNVATVNANGLAIGSGAGETAITAVGTSPSGPTVPGSATLTLTAGGTPSTAALTIYEVGQATGTVTDNMNMINCSVIGGPGCTGSYSSGTVVTLTATPMAGFTFGGWTSNCAVGPPNVCQIAMSANEAVGAIFNQ